MDNQIQKVTWEEENRYLAERGINQVAWNTLCNTLYPGAMHESVILAWDYCQSRNLDIMLKPVHLVPMQVKDAQTGQKVWRDVPMPGIGMYRIQADRSGNYAGADEPEFGPIHELSGVDAYNNQYSVKYPEWCKYTVYKMIDGKRVSFTSKEYWLENYATQSAKTDAPNAMWKKRPFAQLAKCSEAQALRKAWPEIGSEPTAEEMDGKGFVVEEKDITPQQPRPVEKQGDLVMKLYTRGIKAIESGAQTPQQIIDYAKTRGVEFSDNQIKTLNSIKVA